MPMQFSRVSPSFVRTELDPDHDDQPRLDLVAELEDGVFPIVSWHPPPCAAIEVFPSQSARG